MVISLSALTGCHVVTCRRELSDAGCQIIVECGSECRDGAVLVDAHPDLPVDAGSCAFLDNSCR